MRKILSFLVALVVSVTLFAGNVITYTATSKLTETTNQSSSGLHTNAFNVAIINHSFSNGRGTITFAGDLTSIGDRAFFDCSALASISIPKSVTSIGSNAFMNSSSLSSITIPNSVTSIGYCAFRGCSSLPVENNLRYADTYLVEATDKTKSSYTIKEGTKWIGEEAFAGCTSLTSITIPNSVTSIGYGAFFRCSSLPVENNLRYADTYLVEATDKTKSSYTIKEGTRWIGDVAFDGCTSLSSITIPSSVTNIGENALSGLSSLTSINVDAANTRFASVDGVLFNYAKDMLIQYPAGKSLTTYAIPNSVTSIGGYAFLGCSSLTSITIPNSVTSIGDFAFYSCSSLTFITSEAVTPPSCGVECFSNVNKSIPVFVSAASVSSYQSATGWKDFTNIQVLPVITYTATSKLTETTNPSSSGLHTNAFNVAIINHSFSNGTGTITFTGELKSIGDKAFMGCYSLSSITIPSSVTSIGYHVFSSCSSLTSINVDAANTRFASVDGVLFNYAKDMLIQYPEGKSLTTYAIPNSVTSIGEYAFNGCSSLSSITIPNSVKSIGDWAFNRCSSLSSITIPSSVTSIGKYAFSNCSSLPVENNLRYADTYLVEATDKTKSSYTIKEGTRWIEDYVFRDCYSLTSITIPNSVTSIGQYAFSGCSSLTSITSEAVTPPSCGVECFSNVNKSIPVFVSAASVSSYQSATGWKDFTNIQVLPVITYTATSKLTETTNQSSSGLHTNAFNVAIINHSFSNGTGTITFASELTSIGEYAFHKCTSLTSITIPNSVTSIGGNAFRDCSSLSSITIPNSVTSIGLSAFLRCSSLTSITIPNGVTSIGYGVFSGCSSLSSINIPNNVTSIENSVFDGCSSLTSIIIPKSVKSIGFNAFYGCSSLTSITIPNGVTSIADRAFMGCSSLTSITSEAVTPPSCGRDCFSNVNKSIPVFVSAASISSYQSAYGWNEFTNLQALPAITYTATSKLTETTNQSSSGLHTNAFNVAIINHSFSNGIGTITFAGDLTSIGEYAFYHCNALESITIPDGVTRVGSWAFGYCKSILSISLPNTITSIDTSAFESCESLQKITLPLYLQKIESSLFYECYALKSVFIPEGVTSIGDNAFEGCSLLDSVVLPSKLTYLGTSAFDGCETIKSISIPDSITNINASVFSGCSSLTSITIPNRVTSIADRAFWDCSSLTSITSEAVTPPSCGAYCFYGVDKSIPVYIPRASYAIYQNADGWRDFSNWTYFVQVKLLSDSTMGVTKGSGYYERNSTITLSATSNKHYHFVQWSDGNPDNPRSLVLSDSDLIITATFAPDQYKLRLSATHGSVLGSGDYPYLQNVTITATPDAHYHFVRWSDGATDNPRTMTLDKDSTLQAIFAIDRHSVNVVLQNGSATGTGMYDYGTLVNLQINSNAHYHFVEWSDTHSTDKSRSITLTQDTTLYAVIELDKHNITVLSENGTAVGSGTFDYGSSTIISATPFEHYHFEKWSDNDNSNPRTITVTQDQTYSAICSIDTYTISASGQHGTIDGAGIYDYGDYATLLAIPDSGYTFISWSDGSIYNPYVLYVTDNVSLEAIVAPDHSGIDDIVTNNFCAYVVGQTLFVSNNDREYQVFDANGQLIYTGTSPQILLPAKGLYIINLDNWNSKVIVP